MLMSEAFPSKWLRHVDLQGQVVLVVIDKVVMEKIGDDIKPVVYFLGKEKGLGLNKTNANTIVKAYGDNSDGWTGKALELFPSTTEYRGETVDCIRLRPAQMQAQPAAAPPPPVSEGPPPPGDDDIPF